MDIVRRHVPESAAALVASGIPEGAVQLMEDTSRDSIMELIHMPQVVDLIIARGSEEMINHVVKNSAAFSKSGKTELSDC